MCCTAVPTTNLAQSAQRYRCSAEEHFAVLRAARRQGLRSSAPTIRTRAGRPAIRHATATWHLRISSFLDCRRAARRSCVRWQFDGGNFTELLLVAT